MRFREEHALILNLLKDCRDKPVDSIVCKKQSRDIHELLTDHVKRESSVVYDALNEAAVHDPRLKDILEHSEQNLHETMDAADKFFEDCSSSARRMEFIKHYGVFYILLKDRIRHEEAVLFPEFERVARMKDRRLAARLRRSATARPEAP